MKYRVLFFAVLISFFIPVYIYAEEGDASKLVTLLSNITSMQADFVQINKDTRGQLLRKSTGSMLLLRPGKFRWDIKQPQAQQIIADGKQLWIYDPSLAQVIRRHISKANVATSPAALLSDSLDQVAAEYEVNTVRPHQTGLFFQLVPKKNQSSMLQWVELHFNNEQLVGMRLMDNLDQLSEFSFERIRVNPDLNPGFFKFSPPPGTEVVNA